MVRSAARHAKPSSRGRRPVIVGLAAALLIAALALVPSAAAAPSDTNTDPGPTRDTSTASESNTVQPQRNEGDAPNAIGPSPAPEGSSPFAEMPFAQAVPVPGEPSGLLAPSPTSDNVTKPRSSSARVVEKHFPSRHIVDLSVYSESMDGTLPVRLLLPKDWYSKPKAQFPVLYLMPAYGNPVHRNRIWTARTDAEQFFADKNVLVVLPSGGDAGYFSNWWNYGRGGVPTWETFHTVELPQIVQNNWRGGEKRAIAGLSMGGFGAISYAARHPGFYDGAASYSGILHTTMPGVPRLIQMTLADTGLDPYALWGDPVAQRGIWTAHDPYMNAENLEGMDLYVSAAAGMRGEYDSGEVERLLQTLEADNPLAFTRETVLQSGLESVSYVTSRSFVSRLETLGIPVTTHFEQEGLHRWPYWEDELYRSWPVLAEALGLPAS